jgi:ATP-dependent DNA helicase RecG
MTKENLINILSQGETLTVEFKKCHHELSDNVFESVCTFLNRAEGHILLGIADNPAVLGLSRD